MYTSVSKAKQPPLNSNNMYASYYLFFKIINNVRHAVPPPPSLSKNVTTNVSSNYIPYNQYTPNPSLNNTTATSKPTTTTTTTPNPNYMDTNQVYIYID